MRKNLLRLFAFALLIIVGTVSCSNNTANVSENTVSRSLAQIFLYGEKHGIDAIMEREFEIWHEHYHEEGMRHLFLESPYYSCEFLNIWMQENGDEILDAIYEDLEGTAAQVPALKDFYRKIKAQCPETVFHGTDVGHQFFSTGERFLEYLEQNNLEDTEQYSITQEVIKQGKHFYETSDDVYRENKMTENFILAFDSLNGEKVMGIYGGSHIGLDKMVFTGNVPCMGNQLREHYGDIIYSENLSGK